ncbi:predicted protein [Culex quinquefasciatus]|uniref:Predicted protein n=1 Tax=Culex quinquefasciatus TaxID=7176 RepID=B0W8E4_CULQU|nr:predicted protein [Culex quinquefasciatus]|eukprot:XP_001844978.1 predicted protein [Culex quinquefasciatus]
MATEQPSEKLLHDSLVVKEEPPEDDTETPSFCYETVTKEEVTLEDPAEHATTSNELPFKCSECNKSFDHVTKLNRCRLNKTSLKRHELIFHETKTESEKQPSEDAVESSPQPEEKDVRPSLGEGQPTEGQQKKVTVKALQKQRAEKRKKFFLLAKGQPSEQTHQIRLLTIVKDDPPKDASEVSSFCYETVTKEEVILDEHPEPVGEEPPAEIPNELKCSECKRTFDKLSNLQACLRKHKAIRLELYKCRYCGRCFGTKFDNERHEGVHKKGMQPAVDVSTVIPVPEPDVSVSVTQTVPFEEDLLLEDFEEAIPMSKIAVEKADKAVVAAAERLTDESSSTFCYETVIKEELIIEDDAFDDSVVEDEPEEASRCTLSVGQPLEDEARTEQEGDFDESLDEQSAPERLKCDKCQMRCGGQVEHLNHKKTHTNSSEPMALPTEAEDSHMEFDSSSRVACEKSDLPLHCKTCNVFFSNATNFTIHLWKSTLRIFRKIPAKKKPVIRDRVKVVTKETGPFSCLKCDYKTTKKQLFLDHNRGHRAIELGLFKCDLCGTTFETRTKLRRHLVTHSKNEVTIQFLEKVTEDEKGTYTCTVCGKTDMFIRKYAYVHFRTHVLNETKAKNVCEICQKPCLSSYSLRLHMQTHQKLRFTCSTCKQKFKTRKSLMKHRMVHRRNDTFQCTQCDRAFPTRQMAVKHFRVHLPSKLAKGA